jgi:hypothetical protein
MLTLLSSSGLVSLVRHCRVRSRRNRRSTRRYVLDVLKSTSEGALSPFKGTLSPYEGVLSLFEGVLYLCIPRCIKSPDCHGYGWDNLRFFSIQLQARLWEYRSQIKTKAEQVVLKRFKKLHGDDMDAIQDRVKRIEFGTKWCDPNRKDFRFIWQGYDKSPVSHANCVFSPPLHDFDSRETAQGSLEVLA